MSCIFLKLKFKIEETHGNAMEDAVIRVKNLRCCVEEDGTLRMIAEKNVFQG